MPETPTTCECPAGEVVREAALYSCNHPPDDGGDSCDGDDCLGCLARAVPTCPCAGLRTERDQLQGRMEDYEDMGVLRWKQCGKSTESYPGGPLAAYDTLLHEAEAERDQLRADLAEALILLRRFTTFASPSLDTRDRAEALVRKHEAKL